MVLRQNHYQDLKEKLQKCVISKKKSHMGFKCQELKNELKIKFHLKFLF